MVCDFEECEDIGVFYLTHKDGTHLGMLCEDHRDLVSQVGDSKRIQFRVELRPHVTISVVDQEVILGQDYAQGSMLN